ncbi:MFS transporter [Streptantibioticus ferralitis]|uniref:MFS transporter n=1 Tax=Streptantibioticus ferralitis TaxID=236510 RepID=A0ABT5YZI5_9ACTN|nr:MFS transporter [Streptantibioticus ferralitis]MDF2257002.1 MFS transporter [Streptantibioticus ferralitis]
MPAPATSAHAADPVGRALDEAPSSMFHVKAAITSGMGFFTDAYDLNIISTALLLLKPEFHLSADQVGLVGSTSLIASFIGAIVFGRIADIVGRKRVYGIEALIMAVGAILTALAPDFTWLLVTRFILGIGIGGDYPISATIMTEYANRRSRGRQVALMFSTYTAGQVVAFIVALTLLAAGVDHDLAWRLMLGLGALPALAVLYNRRRMPESPRFTAAVVGDHERAASELNAFAAGAVRVTAAAPGQRQRLSLREILTNRRLVVTLLGTAGAWFAYDVAVYGNSISQPEIVKSIAPNATASGVTAINLILAVLFSVTGVVCCVLLMDRVSRKGLQIAGFLVSGAALLAIGLVPGLTGSVLPFALVFGLASFGTTLGPNAGTMVLSAESFPVGMRTTGHGISAGFGKLGAYIGALASPILLAGIGLRDTEIIAAGFYLLGVLFTLLLAEPARRSLEEIGSCTLPKQADKEVRAAPEMSRA